MDNDLQQQITRTLAAAFNLLSAADLSGIKGSDLPTAGQAMVAFQDVIKGLNDGSLVISEPVEEDANETE